MALPSYELLKSKWSELRTTIWELSHYISVSLEKLTEYINEGRKTRIYALAMIINPSIKLEWMEVHWNENDTIKSWGWMLDATYRASIRSQLHVQLPPLTGCDSAHAAAQSLMAGFGCMTRMHNTSVRRSSFTSRPQTPPLSPSPPPVEVESTPAMSPGERAQRDLEQDRKDAEREQQRYDEAGLLDVASEHT